MRISTSNPLIGTFGVVTYAGRDPAARQLTGAITGSQLGQRVLNEHPQHIDTVVNSLSDLHRYGSSLILSLVNSDGELVIDIL